jgi:putative membrane protein
MEQNAEAPQTNHSLPLLQKFKPVAVHLFVPKWKSMENKGNLARDLLAVERTFLAWIRTGLNLIGIGLAIVKFLYIDSNKILIKTTGSILIVMGIFSIIYSWIRSLILTKQIEDDVFSMDTVGPHLFLITGVAVGVLCLLLVYL